MTTTLVTGGPEWRGLITASKVAAILGVSPWESPYSVWQKMKGNVAPESSNEVQRRGQYLEEGILRWWSDRHLDHDIDAYQPTYRLGDWAAATPDAVAYRDCEHEDRDKCGPPCRVLVEAKTAASMDDWGGEGTEDIPTYYLVQVTWQMHVSGVPRCYVPVLGPRLRFAEYVVDYNAEWGEQLERRMREFCATLASDAPPPLDDTVATWDVVRRLHPEIDRGVEVEIPYRLAHKLVRSNERVRHQTEALRGYKSRALSALGRGQYLTHKGVRVARRQPRGDDVSFVITAKQEDFASQEEA